MEEETASEYGFELFENLKSTVDFIGQSTQTQNKDTKRLVEKVDNGVLSTAQAMKEIKAKMDALTAQTPSKSQNWLILGGFIFCLVVTNYLFVTRNDDSLKTMAQTCKASNGDYQVKADYKSENKTYLVASCFVEQ